MAEPRDIARALITSRGTADYDAALDAAVASADATALRAVLDQLASYVERAARLALDDDEHEFTDAADVVATLASYDEADAAPLRPLPPRTPADDLTDAAGHQFARIGLPIATRYGVLPASMSEDDLTAWWADINPYLTADERQQIARLSELFQPPSTN